MLRVKKTKKQAMLPSHLQASQWKKKETIQKEKQLYFD